MRATFGWGAPVDKDLYNEAIKALKGAVTVLNTHLQGKDYLVGGHLTVADIVIGLQLTLAFQTVLDGGFRKAMINVTKWVERLITLPEVVKRCGNIKFAQKVLPPTLAKTEEKPKA